ncbi:MAG: DUF6655 family protein [Rhizomicrobium sp.]
MHARNAVVRSFGFAFVIGLGGCTTIRATSPTRSAQEMLMITTAADRAAAALAAEIPADLAAYVDPSGFAAEDKAYALATIENALLKRGIRLVSDRQKAQAVIAPRAGVLSTDEKQSFIGIPALPAPTPASGAVVALPSLSLYRENVVNGIAKFAATVYDPRTGRLIVSTDPAFGFSHSTEGVVLFLISWRRNDSDIDLSARRPKTTPK